MNNEASNKLQSIDRIKCKENELENLLGPYYNNTMNHKMKDKDTLNKINPTNGLWSKELIYLTTNQKLKANGFFDPYLVQTNNIKKNPFKTWEEEMSKFKSMGKKAKDDKKEEKK